MMKKSKRLLSFLLCLILALGLFPASVLAAGIPFRDVAEGEWYYDAVEYTYKNGLISGTSSDTFSPNDNTTRAMIVTILYRLEGSPDVSGGNAFTDVEAGSYYEDPVTWAAANGIVSGISATEFAPYTYISREQMVTFLYRYAAFKGQNMEGTVSLADFEDAASVSDWALEAMGWAVGEGLITGMSATTIEPAGTTTRAQAATILTRFCQSAEQQAAFEAKDMDDFAGQEIISFDSSRESNFAVLAEDTVTAEAAAGTNTLVRADDENGVYVFENADATITGLSVGDVFYHVYGSGVEDYILLKVGTIQTENGQTTITAGEAELSDFFTYIDVDMSVEVEPDAIASSQQAAEHILHADTGPAEPEEGDSQAQAQAEIAPSLSYKVSITAPLSGGTLSTSLEGKITANIKIQYDFVLFGEDYFEIRMTLKLENTGDLALRGNLTGKSDTYTYIIGSLLYPLGATGLFLDGDLAFVFDIDAGVELAMKVDSTMEVGFQYDSKNGYKEINKNDNKTSLNLDGKVSVTFGFEADIGVSFLKVVEASLTGFAGLENTAKSAFADISTDVSEKHLCPLCIDGECYAVAELGFKVELFAGVVTPVDVSAKLVKLKLADFYISFYAGDGIAEFGWGDCPHKAYLLEVKALWHDGSPVENALISIASSDGLTSTGGEGDANGFFSTYLAPGTYTVSALDDWNGEHVSASETVTIGKEKARLTLTLEPSSEVVYLRTQRTVAADGEFTFPDGGTTLNGEEIQDEGVTTYTYDNYGRVASELTEYPYGWSSSVSYTYDGAGRVSTRASRENFGDGWTDYGTTRYNYDAYGNVSSIDYRASGSSSYQNTSNYIYTYDENGNILSKTEVYNGAAGETTYFTYDADGNCLTETRDYWQTTYTYDSSGRLIQEEEVSRTDSARWYRTSYTYDSRGDLVRMVYTYADYDYIGGGDLVQYSTTYQYSYTYDSNGCLTQFSQRIDGMQYATVYYEYAPFTIQRS